MPVEIPSTRYSGTIKEIKLGKGEKSVTIGGETSYPFFLHEGTMPHKPRIAMEVWDTVPEDWPAAAIKPFKDVLENPVAWAKKCIQTYGADMIALQLISIDPNGLNRGPEEASALVKKVADAIDVPLMVWGVANHEKDTAVLTKVAEVCRDKKLILGPVEEKDYKIIGAAAIACQHTIAASSPIDINLAKQLNILLGNLGVPDGAILMDPTVSGIGYGLEYAYSVMERMRTAALTQQDEKLQYPIICNLSKEVWKSKEIQQPDDAQFMGNAEKRGILLEAMSAMALLEAGGDVIVMRHPEAVKLIKEMISELIA